MPLFEVAGWLVRRDIQFHFANQGYASFDDFLGTLNSQKRKQLRKERLRAVEGLRIEDLTGDANGAEHWDAMWLFYQDTGARNWGHPYLTREAFVPMGGHMAERAILLIAYDAAVRPVAGALHLRATDSIRARAGGPRQGVGQGKGV